MGERAQLDLVANWCASRLGPGELTQLSVAAGGQMSKLYRYTSAEGEAAIKVRAESLRRVNACLSLQKILAKAGFPCAEPLIDAETMCASVISAEKWLAGGEVMKGDTADSAQSSAALLAELMAILHGHPSDGLAPPPPWIRWNPSKSGLWPPNDAVERMVDQNLVPASIKDWAFRVSARLGKAGLPPVPGHGDWEAQNIRWKGDSPWAVYDYDSLVSLPEAAIVGAASGAFASVETPSLASIDSSETFISSYESTRRRPFTHNERQVAWAASLWPGLHNARGEHLFRSPLVASAALADQARQRLTLAGA